MSTLEIRRENGKIYCPLILGSSGENLNGVPDLRVTPDDRIQLAVSCHLDQISAVLVQRVVVLLRILTCNPLIAAHLIERIQETVFAHTVSSENRGARRVRSSSSAM